MDFKYLKISMSLESLCNVVQEGTLTSGIEAKQNIVTKFRMLPARTYSKQLQTAMKGLPVRQLKTLFMSPR